jgi:methionine synthase I (cobalamin-dependent)
MSELGSWLRNGPVVTDGAWGTELQARSLQAGELPDLWNLVKPEHVESVARAYVEAGSRVILTNTFRSNAITLADHGLADQCEAINRAGAEISRRVAGMTALVFASLGPCGKMVFMDEVPPRAVRDAFARQAKALALGGADALLLETMSDPGEARLALEACRDTGLPVIVSFAFDTGRAKDRTMTGATPEHVAVEMAEAGASAIGANCGAGIEAFPALCRRLKQSSGLPVWIKPNAGLPEMSGGVAQYATSAEAFAAHVPALVEAGASFIGGCCGSNPDFVRAIAEVLAKCATD